MGAVNSLRANPRRICTYAFPLRPRFLSSLVSAHTKPPRICTFHSYFKSRSFCTYVRACANSFRFCTCKSRREGRYQFSKEKCMDFLRTITSLTAPRCNARPATVVRSSAKFRPFTINNLQTQFRATLLFPSDCAFPGGWGLPAVALPPSLA